MSDHALIFDVDGTLAETEELHRRAFNEAFAEAGLAWHWDQYLYKDLLAVAGGKERLRHFIALEDLYVPESVDTFVPKLHARKTELYGDGVKEGRIELRAGVRALIEQAKAEGIRLAIATTTTRDNVDSLLNATIGHAEDFEVIACGDMVANKKPAPDIFLLALETLGLPAEKCLAFEDSQNGLAAARAAGLRCVVTPALYTRDEDFSGATLVMDDCSDAEAIIRLLKSS